MLVFSRDGSHVGLIVSDKRIVDSPAENNMNKEELIYPRVGFLIYIHLREEKRHASELQDLGR